MDIKVFGSALTENPAPGDFTGLEFADYSVGEKVQTSIVKSDDMQIKILKQKGECTTFRLLLKNVYCEGYNDASLSDTLKNHVITAWLSNNCIAHADAIVLDDRIIGGIDPTALWDSEKGWMTDIAA